jgi:acetyl esterase/lipase
MRLRAVGPFVRRAFAPAALVVAAAVGIAGAAPAAPADTAQSHSCVGSPIERLAAQVAAAEDVLAIEKLQRAYGYYVDKGMWEDVANLFTADAVANYPAGVFVGYKSIREHLYMNVGGKKLGELGLGDGRLYNHMNIQPVIHLDPGGRTARGRWRALAMFGSLGGIAVWAEGVYEMRYRKEGGVWKIEKLDYYDGFGAPYQTGWAAPAEAPAAEPRRAFRHLAHPPDRPRESCGGFPKACIAPFDYSNPGTTASGAAVWTVGDLGPGCARRHPNAARAAAELLHRAMRLRDAQQIENLQRIYGYYLDRAMWDQLADLFAADGTIEMGQRGVYVGKHRIRAFLDLLGHHGLTYGWLNDHIQLQPVVDVAPDGKTARLRSRELDMTGVYGKWGKWSEGTYENTFVKQGGVWRFQSLHYYPTFITDYDKGWAKDAEPVPQASSTLPPDRPPSEIYAIYPKAFVPPFHYRNPVTREPPHYPPVGAPSADVAAAALMPAGERSTPPPVRDVSAAVAEAEQIIARVKDYDELENLEGAYGYYLDKDLWTDLSNLFADRSSMELAQRGVYEGRAHIHGFLLKGLGRGHEGPVAGMLGNHLQLQPVIDVSRDGKTAKIRSRALQQMAFGPRAAIASGIYENEAVKVDGIWRFSKDHVYNTLAASYLGGWAHAAQPRPPGESKVVPPDAPPTMKFEMFPVVYDIPFHYANPVTGRTDMPPLAKNDEAPRGRAQAASGGAPPGMPASIAAALREIGPRIDGPRTAALYAPLFPKEPYANVSLARDIHYGPHERNVLDVFTAPEKGRGKPVVVFVHGGGFTRGAKHTPGSPFYDNIGLWAAAHGLVGVTMNYRLAPQFQYPSGIEDVTAAVHWLQGHIAAYGGDPHEIFLWGHSAGAAHVADYLAHVTSAGSTPGIAGAILTSGFYDLGHEVSVWKDYYGEDLSRYPERSSLAGLLKTAIPLLVTDAELDPPMMVEQTDELTAARAQIGRPVEHVWLPNHSHISETYAVGTADESLSEPVLEFIRRSAAARGTVALAR